MRTPELDFSVVIATRDRLESLRVAVRHALEQTLARERFELIVVDDGGRDGTAAYLEEQAALGTLRWIRQDVSTGPAAARNAGVKIARGEWIAFTDDDCLVPADWLSRAADSLRSFGAVALGGGVLNGLPGLLPEVYQDMATYLFETRNREPGKSTFLTTSNFFCRRDVLIESGAFDERFRCGAEDRDLVRRLVSAGHRVCADPALVIEHRHIFTPGSYLSHLARQGRGSWLYFHAAGGREREASPLDLLQMLRYAAGRGDRGILRLFLAVCGQAAVACGYAGAMLQRGSQPPQ